MLRSQIRLGFEVKDSAGYSGCKVSSHHGFRHGRFYNPSGCLTGHDML